MRPVLQVQLVSRTHSLRGPEAAAGCCRWQRAAADRGESLQLAIDRLQIKKNHLDAPMTCCMQLSVDDGATIGGRLVNVAQAAAEGGALLCYQP